MTVRDYLTSLVRTVVPVITAGLIAAATHLGADVDHAALAVLVDGLVVAVWYGLVRAAEMRWPQVGVLLGWKASPSYVDASTIVAYKGPDGIFRAGAAGGDGAGAMLEDAATLNQIVEGRHEISE